MEHFIATLDDRDLENQLTLLRLMGVGEAEETLRAWKRMENRQMRASMRSNKLHQRTTMSSNPILSKPARAVRAIRKRVKSSGSESDSIGSDEDVDRRQVFLTATPDQEELDKDHRTWQKNAGEWDGHGSGGRSKA